MPRAANPTLRNDILAAALRLVEEKGAAGLTMREVASLLGYSATAIYQHFTGKEDLLLTLRLQAGDLLAAEMENARREPTLEAQLQEMGRRYVQFGLENPAYYRLIFQDSVPGFIPTPEQLARLRRSWSIMRDTLATWAKARGLRGLDVNQEANVLWAIGHGVTSLALAGRFPFSAPSESFALFALAVHRWQSGILSQQSRRLPASTQKQEKRQRRAALSIRRSVQRSTKTRRNRS